MEEQLTSLEQKVDQLQKTLDWMIERMINAQSLREEDITMADIDATTFLSPIRLPRSLSSDQ